jgi:alcohol dehydrogenase class IV
LGYDAREGGVARIRDVLPPLIAIPATAGTGSEVSCSAHLLGGNGRGINLVSPLLVPRVAICDPTLTVNQPSDVTAGTGMDALTHCIETYLSTAYNPPADGIALEGLKRAAAHIERAVENGSDLNARRELMAASINGALALQKGLGGVHAASHALGGLDGYDLSHGALNAVLLPHVLRFNAPAVSERYPALEHAMGLPAGTGLAEGIAGLAARIGLPRGLGKMGVDDAAIEAAAPRAESDHTNGSNPRRASATDYRAIMQAAY